MEHTPGPWIIHDYRPEGFTKIEILGPVDSRSKHRHGRSHIVPMRGVTDPADEACMMADASLIAAAPDLLVVLKIAQDHLAQYRKYADYMSNEGKGPYISTPFPPQRLDEMIETAIAKAEGRDR